jgi:hypothetical protein
MSGPKKIPLIALASALLLALSACTAKVGSEQWCADMKKKPKGDWSMNEAADFTKHCILK